jgi:hypothetical protein
LGLQIFNPLGFKDFINVGMDIEGMFIVIVNNDFWQIIDHRNFSLGV